MANPFSLPVADDQSASFRATLIRNRNNMRTVEGIRIKSPRKNPLNAIEHEPVPTRVLNPYACEASNKTKQRSYRKTKLKFLLQGDHMTLFYDHPVLLFFFRADFGRGHFIRDAGI